MKTEKRLTMALSVLVALMMLAVPLASSSNLFVDGGQTNSNGDAPSLSTGDTASTNGYTITFQLNADGKSLDQVDVDALVGTLKDDGTAKALGTWYKNDNGDLCLLVTEPKYIQDIITALYTGNTSRVTKNGYNFMSWKNVDSGELFDASVTGKDLVKKDLTFAAQWELQSNYVEVPVTVNFDGDVKEYYKAYLANEGKITIGGTSGANDGKLYENSLLSVVIKVGKLSTEGYVINNEYDKDSSKTHITSVYSTGDVTYGDNKALPAAGKTIPSTSSLTVTYTFNSAQYSKITVHSIAFKDGKDVMLYADKAKPYTYVDVLNAIQAKIDGTNTPIVLTTNDNALVYEEDGVSVKTSDGKYLATGWNEGAALLESTLQTTATEFTLDAKLNGYNVVFMVNGQYEVKFVEFGKLSQDLCTLDVSGLNHWVWIPFNNVEANTSKNIDKMTGLEGIDLNSSLDGKTLFQTFSFASQSNIDTVEKVAATITDADIPSVVFIACFESPSNTAYAIFDANGYTKKDASSKIIPSDTNRATEGYFGDNENIDRIIVSGKISTTSETNKTPITKPSVTPTYDENKLFIDWNVVGSSVDPKNYGTSEGSITGFYANVDSYEHIISFYVDDKISAKLYYSESLSLAGDNTISGDLVAFEYDGKIYAATAANLEKAMEALQPEKDGYSFIQWNDKDGKKVLSDISLSNGKITVKTGDGFPKEGVKTDMDVYAKFDARSYTIKYVNTFEGSQTQTAYVDQAVTLYGKDTFIHEGYVLKGWSTVPGNSGENKDLGGSFVLNGADFKKLAGPNDKAVVIELYSVWEYNGGSNVPGGNTDGGNDNTALYLIAGMLAVIAILAIVGIVLMRRK